MPTRNQVHSIAGCLSVPTQTRSTAAWPMVILNETIGAVVSDIMGCTHTEGAREIEHGVIFNCCSVYTAVCSSYMRSCSPQKRKQCAVKIEGFLTHAGKYFFWPLAD